MEPRDLEMYRAYEKYIGEKIGDGAAEAVQCRC